MLKSLSAALILLLFTLQAPAQLDLPVIEPNAAYRDFFSGSNTEWAGPGSNVELYDSTLKYDPFRRTFSHTSVGELGSTASGTFTFESQITQFTISASGHGHAESHFSDPEGFASSGNFAIFTFSFRVPVDTTFVLTGSFQIEDDGTTTSTSEISHIEIFMNGLQPDLNYFNILERIDATGSTEPHEFIISQAVKANEYINLNFYAGIGADSLAPGDATADFDFNFTIDFGDLDQDGLHDSWETDGIDLDGDGIPEIDLPAMGANPNKKNLFIELDSQVGVPVDQTAVTMVEQAFANAPADLINNPDGSDGIILRIVVDDNDLTNEVYSGTGWPPEFDAAKSTRFGTAALRAHPDWNEIKEAYRLVFRYGIWGQDIQKDDGKSFGGKSELPGNDFFLAAGNFTQWQPDPDLRTKALAGLLMHEFGHCLSLQHGGPDRESFYKPNHLSVMNYAYIYPSKKITVEGTAVADAWVLDYARTAPATLDELYLYEDEGLDGPAGRKIIFNTSPDGVAPVLQLADADADEIDWNLSGGPIETERVEVDITRFRGNTDSYNYPLITSTDWDKIWYHLSGAPDFADGAHDSSDSIEPFTEDDFNAMNSYVVHDRSTPNCAVDLNADGIVDIGDIQIFIALFLAQDFAADLNADGFLDIGDITEFVNLFLAGC